MSKVIVQPLIEALGELVTQVSLIIVQNKAQNKAPPQELPMCVVGITKAAGTLTQVAKNLASDEYDDFPTIQEEIVAGATDVEVSSKQLNEATVTLVKGSADDRAGAWDSLGEAVRIMAQNTAILLHIVYGAEIKKIFALSSYADGKLKDLLRGVDTNEVGLYQKNPQLFVNKVQAAMEDVQKLAQGVQQKAGEEESEYARKELELVAQQLQAKVEPFVAHANELLADPNNAKSKQATIHDLKDMIATAELVGVPRKKRPAALQDLVAELTECASRMMEIETTTPEGQKEVQRMQSTLNDITRANRVSDMGPYTAMMNQIVELHKDLELIESLVNNPSVSPLGSTDAFDMSDPHSQTLLNIARRMPEEEKSKAAIVAALEKLTTTVTREVAPVARQAHKSRAAPDIAKAKTAIAGAKGGLEDVISRMDVSAEDRQLFRRAEQLNTAAQNLAALGDAKDYKKDEVARASRAVMDLVCETSTAALAACVEGQLKDLLVGVEASPVGVYEKNPALFKSKIQATMDDIQKLASALKQKGASKDSIELSAQLMAVAEPLKAQLVELVAKPKDAKAKEAATENLKDAVRVAERVRALHPAQAGAQDFVAELIDCVSKMQEVQSTSAEGQREAQRLHSTIAGLCRANKVYGGERTNAMLNGALELFKDLDQMELLVSNPNAKPLASADAFDLADPHTQSLLNVVRRIQPDETGGRDQVLSDAEKFAAVMTNDVLPLAANARRTQNAADVAKAKEAVANAHAALDAVVGDMGVSAEHTGQIKAAVKANAVAIKLGAMAGSKAVNKQDIFSAAKDLTELLGEMSSLLGLAQSGGDDDGGARGALVSQMAISGALATPSQPQPKPKPGSAKAFARKVAPAATQYKGPARALALDRRDSVQGGFLAVGAGAEELKTLALPPAQKGANLLPASDPVISGVRSLGEQLSILCKAATSGDNASLLAAGKAIHEQMKAYSAELRRRAQACKDPRIAHELITLSNQLKNWSVQLKILASVKAGSGGGRDSDKALISMARLISDGLRNAPQRVLAGLLA